MLVTCLNPKCENQFKPKNAQHGFCSAECRRAARNSGVSWKWLRVAIIERDGDTCQHCGEEDCRKEVHHIEPLCKGGSNIASNLITLCTTCHRKEHKSWRVINGKKAAAQRRQRSQGGRRAA